MAYDEALAERIHQVLARKRGITEKKMFGGIGFLLSGNMCVGVWKRFLLLRLGAEQADDALRQQHVKEFDITGKPMKGWVMVEPAGCAEDSSLESWVEKAVRFVKTLPKKEK
ncbi:MAG: TfoX/Sxy family protein [Gemmataceae bacterium]|nr:TfoX/Sxy family protein [Gemmataceae bacterium]MCI0741587.1 TfoX/Sxy family protein [Gemmataceae bacterium]